MEVTLDILLNLLVTVLLLHILSFLALLTLWTFFVSLFDQFLLSRIIFVLTIGITYYDYIQCRNLYWLLALFNTLL